MSGTAFDAARLVADVAAADPRGDREALLTALYAAGLPTHKTADQPPPGPPHTLLLWAFSDLGAELYVIEQAAIDETLDEALDASNGVVLHDPRDCSAYQLGALFRVHAATGRTALDALAARLGQAHEVIGAGVDLSPLPNAKSLKGLVGRWRERRVAVLTGDSAAHADPKTLDVNLTRAVAMADLVRWES